MAQPKKDEILQACMEEFAHYGYEGANTNRIAERAGVSKGLLFHYFGSKEKLYISAFEDCVQDISGMLEDFSTEGMDFLEAMLAYSRLKAQFFMTHPLHYKLLLHSFYQPPAQLREQLQAQYAAFMKQGMDIVSGLIDRLPLKPGVPKAQVLELIMAVSGIVENKYVQAMLREGEYSPGSAEQAKQEYLRLMELVLYGVAEDKRKGQFLV